MQGEFFCRCVETGGQRCTRCDWQLEQLQKTIGRRAAWLRHVGAYVRPAEVFGQRRGFELRRGAARFEMCRYEGGPVDAFAIGPNGSRTFVGSAREVFAAGAEEFPTGYRRAAG